MTAKQLIAVLFVVLVISIIATWPNQPTSTPAPIVQVAPPAPAHAAKVLKQPKPRKKTRAEIAAENAAFDRNLCKQGTLLAAQLGEISPSDYVDSCK